jgi:hypothetical protein
VEGSFEFGATGLYLDLYYFDGSTWLRPIRSSYLSIQDLAKAPDGSIVAAGIDLGGEVPSFVLRGRQQAWSTEKVDTSPDSEFFDSVWVSDTGRIYVSDDALWVSEEP